MASNKVPVKAVHEFFAVVVTMCVHEIAGSGLASGRPLLILRERSAAIMSCGAGYT